MPAPLINQTPLPTAAPAGPQDGLAQLLAMLRPQQVSPVQPVGSAALNADGTPQQPGQAAGGSQGGDLAKLLAAPGQIGSALTSGASALSSGFGSIAALFGL